MGGGTSSPRRRLRKARRPRHPLLRLGPARLLGGAIAAAALVAVVAFGLGRGETPTTGLAELPLIAQVAGVTVVPEEPAARPTIQVRIASSAARPTPVQPSALQPAPPRATAPPARPAAVAVVPANSTLESVVADQLGPYVDRLGDENFGVVVESVATGERYAHNEAKLFASGSVYKLAVAAEILRRVDVGEMRLEDQITVQAGDQLEAEPEGGLPIGEKVTIRRALEAMMTVSSNAASYALMRQIGRGELNAQLAAAGMPRTSVPLLGAPGRSLHAEWAVTTPADFAHLLRQIATDKVLAPPTRAELRRLLAIPETIDPLVDVVPRQALFSKTGQLDDATNIAALLQTGRGPVVVSIFTTAVGPGEAAELIADLGRALYALG